MTVVKTMENTLNPPLEPCKSELRKSLPRAKRGKRTEVEQSLEIEIINGKRKSRRGRPSQCTEFWLMYKANSEKKSESADVEPKSQGQMFPASEQKSFPPPSSEKFSSSLPMSPNSPTSKSPPITSLAKFISKSTFTNEVSNPVFLPSTSLGINSQFSPFLTLSQAFIPPSPFSNFITATPKVKRRFSERTDGNEQVPSKMPVVEIPKTNATAQEKRRKQPKTDIPNSSKGTMIKEHESLAAHPNTFGTPQEGSSNEKNCLPDPIDLSPPSSRSTEQNNNREHCRLQSPQNSPAQPGQSAGLSSVAVKHFSRFTDAIPNDHWEKTTSIPKTIPSLTTSEPAFNTRIGSASSNRPRSETISKELHFSSGQIIPNKATYATSIREFVRERQTSWTKNPSTINGFDAFLTESTGNIDANQECLNLSKQKSANLPNSSEAHPSRQMSGANVQTNSSADLPEDLSLHALDLSTTKVPLDLRCL